MTTYKILRMDEQQIIIGIVLEQKVTEIAELKSFDFSDETEQKIVSIIREKSSGSCEGHYFIAQYDNGKYVKCKAVLFGEHNEEEYCEPFLDCAENDFRVACDIAHKKLTNEQKWNDIITMADKFNLMNSVIDHINEWFYENEL